MVYNRGYTLFYFAENLAMELIYYYYIQPQFSFYLNSVLYGSRLSVSSRDPQTAVSVLGMMLYQSLVYSVVCICLYPIEIDCELFAGGRLDILFLFSQLSLVI